MYSAEDVHSRFTVNQYNADHLVAVRLNGTQWQYNTNAAWVNFTPVSSDRLLAEVDFTADTAKMLGWNRVYYSLSAQALEERHGSQAHQQYVWGLRFVDDLILRERDTTDNGILDERLYSMHDLRFSIVAVANASGVVQERYTYDAYGIRTVMDSLFVEQASTTVDWQFAYTGRRLDSATGLYFFRARYYSAELGRFVSRDPLQFVDGMSLYRGYFMPGGVDPFGLKWSFTNCTDQQELALLLGARQACSRIEVALHILENQFDDLVDLDLFNSPGFSTSELIAGGQDGDRAQTMIDTLGAAKKKCESGFWFDCKPADEEKCSAERETLAYVVFTAGIPGWTINVCPDCTKQKLPDIAKTLSHEIGRLGGFGGELTGDYREDVYVWDKIINNLNGDSVFEPLHDIWHDNLGIPRSSK